MQDHSVPQLSNHRPHKTPSSFPWALGIAPVLILWLLAPSPSLACNVPVFRYALEHWPADPYEAIVFHSGPLDEGRQSLVERLRKAGKDSPLNLEVVVVDLASNPAEEMRSLWEEAQRLAPKPQPPAILLRYPRALGPSPIVWSGPLNEASIESLQDSPARRALAERLLGGDSAVWLLLESGDAKRDAQAAQLLQEQSRKLETTLKLPELTPEDPALSPAVPVKIAFSTVRIAANDPAEPVLLAILNPPGSPAPHEAGPRAFAVIGRGRALPPLAGEELAPERLQYVAEFATGACSCEAKLLNPGLDLLLAADWSRVFGDASPLVAEMPPLTSLSQFAQMAAASPPLTPGPSLPPAPAAALPNSSVPSQPAMPPRSDSQVPASPPPVTALERNILLVLVLLLTGGAVGSWIVKRYAARARA